MSEGKVCRHCGVWKEIEAFAIHRASKGGRLSICRPCRTVQRAANEAPEREARRQIEATRAAELAARIRAVLGDVPGKICRGCGEIKPLSEFSKGVGNPDGLQYNCKDCNRVYAEQNREHIRQRSSRYYHDKIGTIKVRRRLYRERMGDALRAQKRAEYWTKYRAVRLKGRKFALNNGTEKLCTKCDTWKPFDHFARQATSKDGLSHRCKSCFRAYYWANWEEKKQRNRERYWSNPEQSRAKRRAWSAANPEKQKENRRREYQRHKPYYLTLGSKRRALISGNGGSHTAAEWAAMCDFFGNVCLCCGAADPLDRDHVIPISKGGRDDIENLQPLCGYCNSTKNNKHDTDYRDPAKLTAFLASLRG